MLMTLKKYSNLIFKISLNFTVTENTEKIQDLQENSQPEAISDRRCFKIILYDKCPLQYRYLPSFGYKCKLKWFFYLNTRK